MGENSIVLLGYNNVSFFQFRKAGSLRWDPIG